MLINTSVQKSVDRINFFPKLRVNQSTNKNMDYPDDSAKARDLFNVCDILCHGNDQYKDWGERVLKTAKEILELENIKKEYRGWAHFYAAMACRQLGQKEEALNHFKKTLDHYKEILNESPGFFEERGKLYFDLGRYKESEEHLEKYMESGFVDSDTLDKLEIIKEKSNKPLEFINFLKKVLKALIEATPGDTERKEIIEKKLKKSREKIRKEERLLVVGEFTKTLLKSRGQEDLKFPIVMI